MPLTLDQLEAVASKPSPAGRAALIERLHELKEPADPEVQAAWDEEIARRIQELDSGQVKCIPCDDLMARIRTKRSS
jgi:putative addiction module component (TIGR02574 family)